MTVDSGLLFWATLYIKAKKKKFNVAKIKGFITTSTEAMSVFYYEQLSKIYGSDWWNRLCL